MFFPEQFNFYHKELRFASYLSFFYFNFELMKRFFMSSAGFDILTAIKIQVVIFCVVRVRKAKLHIRELLGSSIVTGRLA